MSTVLRSNAGVGVWATARHQITRPGRSGSPGDRRRPRRHRTPLPRLIRRLAGTQTFTFLITDIQGSTALLRRVGETDYARLLARYRDVTRSVVARHDGEEIDTQGDSFFIVFPSPRAAVAAAVEMQQELSAEREAEAISVRMGLHTGEATRTATGLVGLDIHRAARVSAVAHGRQVLLSESTEVLVRDVLPDGSGLTDLGHHRLKDLGRPEHIFQLDVPGVRQDFPPLRSLDNPALPNNLPAQLANFIGRDREVGEVQELLSVSRLVTLTGPGGSGKTRLALQVAAEMLDGTGDGVWFVELAPLDDDSAVPDAIAAALGLTLGEGPSLEVLATALAPQRAVVIMDNCEHLVGGCAKVADAVLRRGPYVRFLATSREALGISGEAIYQVPSLGVPDDGEEGDLLGFDAVALLLDRARSQGVELDLDRATSSALAAICRRLDGMPLAIELAAARLRSLSLETLEQRLDQRFRLLTGGSRSAPERQQTLKAAVGWSFSLLTAAERTLMQRLSVFAGGFDLEAAETVCAMGRHEVFEIADLLGSLVDKSLVVADRRGGRVRYRLLETIRAFAAEELAASDGDQVAPTAQAHMEYFLGLAEAIGAGFEGRDQAGWFERFEPDEPNVSRAIEYAGVQQRDVETLLRFGKALRRVWVFLRSRAREILRQAVDDPKAEDHPHLLAHALVSCCLSARGNEATLALSYGERALALARTFDDERLLLDALFSRAASCYFASRPEEGMAAGSEGVQRARQLGDPRMLAASLMAYLLCADELDPSATAELFDEAISAAAAAGDRDLEETLHTNAAVHELRRGDLPAARAQLESAIEIGESVYSGRMHYAFINLGWVLWQQGELDQARSLFVDALRNTRRSGDMSGVSYAILGIGCLLVAGEEWNEAAETLGAAQAARDAAGGQWEDPEGSYREACLERVRAALGDDGATARLAKGRSRLDSLMDELCRSQVPI